VTEPATELLVVDGTYELYRAFYGAPRKATASGQEVGAALGIARSLHALARTTRASHLAVAFDTVIESFRNGLLPSYKTGDGIDPELWAQFPLAEEVTEAIGLRVLRMIDFEADDALASLARAGANSGLFERVVLATPDKDLMQCVEGNRIVTWDRMRQKYYDEAAVIEKLGVPPHSVPDYLALVGDPADGIPGLPRWGARTAARVLAVYGHLEQIPSQARDWDPALVAQLRGVDALAQTLQQKSEDARLYKTVATMRQDLSLFTSWDELCKMPPDRARLSALATAWEAEWLREL
jgi:5'-3' exonuclease